MIRTYIVYIALTRTFCRATMELLLLQVYLYSTYKYVDSIQSLGLDGEKERKGGRRRPEGRKGRERGK